MRVKIRVVALAAVCIAALAGNAGIANAAQHHKRHHATRHQTNTAPTALTGDTKTKAEAAALAAVPGGTVTRSKAARPDNEDGAAYVVDVTKSDDSRVVVLEDSGFNVLSVRDAPDHAGPGGGCHRDDSSGTDAT